MVSGTSVEAKEMERCGQIGDISGERTDRSYWWFDGRGVKLIKE